jgi:hypothetical protein
MRGLRILFASGTGKHEPASKSEVSVIRSARQQFLFIAIAMVVALYPLRLGAKGDECTQTANMQVYSNAFVTKDEAGDLVGYELALRQASDSTVKALLFVYEGGAADGINLPGRVSGKKLTIEGSWVEHLTEYPSKKEIVQTHLVKIAGDLDSKWFRGTITIGDMVASQTVRLKRVNHTWVCKQ